MELQTERFPRIEEERTRKARLRGLGRIVMIIGGFAGLFVMSLFDTSHASVALRLCTVSALALPLTLGSAIFNVADRASSARWLAWAVICVVTFAGLYYAIARAYL